MNNWQMLPKPSATGKQLRDVLQDKQIQQVMTDFRKPYEHFVPSDIHIQSKAKTYTVEGYNFSHTFGITLWIVSLSKIPY